VPRFTFPRAVNPEVAYPKQDVGFIILL